MRELGKSANTKCQHQRFHKGCAIYGQRSMPPACKLWNCRWLVEDDTADLRRPDRSRYVIDIMPDFIRVQNDDTGEITNIEVIQIWIDPKHPTAHRDPALRAYLERRASEGRMALVRFDAKKGMLLIAPALNSTGEWIEHDSAYCEPEHSAAEVVAALQENVMA